MSPSLPRAITDAELRAYREDGVVCLRGMFDADWVERLRAAVDADKAAPSPMAKNINEEGGTGDFTSDTFVWRHVEGFRQAVFSSPGAALAGAVMGAAKVNLIFDQILVKEPGTSTRTLWHHDGTYWPVAGDQISTLWVALDHVGTDTGAVEYVKGSHRWGKRFLAVSFNPNQKYEEDLPPVPDIDAERDRYDFAQFDMAPGDCTLHHALTVHGAPGNTSTSQRRRAYVQRWAGDDVVYNPRPNLQRMLEDPGVAPGAPLDSDLFPVVWRAEDRGQAVANISAGR